MDMKNCETDYFRAESICVAHRKTTHPPHTKFRGDIRGHQSDHSQCSALPRLRRVDFTNRRHLPALRLETGCRHRQCTTPSGKNRIVAAILALLVGGLGIHKFYLGQIGMGIVYLIFFWTFIPALIAFVEAIIYLTMSDDAFAAKYG